MVRVTTNKLQIFTIVAKVLNDRETRKPFEITKKWSVSVPLMKDAKIQFPVPFTMGWHFERGECVDQQGMF